jgi:hypothetical protein
MMTFQRQDPGGDEPRRAKPGRAAAKLQSAVPGGVPEWPKGTGCKPVGSAYGGSNPPAPISDLREGRRIDRSWEATATIRRLALLAQLVEHLHGKEGVDGSSPSEGFKKPLQIARFARLHVAHSGDARSHRGRTGPWKHSEWVAPLPSGGGGEWQRGRTAWQLVR